MTEENKNIHFIGVGGVGMSGIARVAKDQGFNVSGSDMRESRYTQQLEDVGVKVFIGHDASNIEDDNTTIVVSTAIMDNNPELSYAKEHGLKIMHRAEMLAYLGRDLETLAVAGTHGKTTTSSMLAYTLDKMGLNPTFLVGGTVMSYMTNAHSGTGEYYVVEADESDKSFTYLSPKAVIVTNIEADHLDHYSDLSEIYDKFKEFISSVPEDGLVVVCGDSKELVELADQVSAAKVITYGLDSDCNSRVIDHESFGMGSKFTLDLDGQRTVQASIAKNPGIHNVVNAAAVLTLIYNLGLDVDKAAECLADFEGVKRRFDFVGKESNITVVDDYAHHPTEIAATIKAARDLDYNHIHVLFQPHRYSRAGLFTDVLRDEFGAAFNLADTVTFMDVYPAGETPIPGINGKTFLNVVLDNPDHPQSYYIPRRIDVASHMADIAEDGDLILTLGAGDITAMGKPILDEIKGA